ncbi:MAG: sensor histidine kinase [Methanospirillum sp.]|uniref:sensor histidine kinase n=1 Tax=Methanospirillum sp. TaxID=45200 RepID=UPI00236C5F6D|nr:ATP-binding protein [Methanospirillum sp.]MDD1729961.1 sensor histidine kinase [Methanospirillum sp.]
MAFRCRADAALGFEHVDEGSKRVTGYTHADLVETGMICLPDLVAPAGRDAVRRQIQDAINRQGSFAIPFSMLTKDRTQTDGLLIGQGMYSGPLTITGIEGYILRMQTPVQSSSGLSTEMYDRIGHVPSDDHIANPEKGSEKRIRIPEPDPEAMSGLISGVRNSLQLLEQVIRMKAAAAATTPVEIRDLQAFTYTLDAHYQNVSIPLGSDRIPACAYFRAITSNFSELFADQLNQVTVTTHCEDDQTMEADASIPVGMMVTELLINCVRHAFIPGEAGRIELWFTRENDMYNLEVRDSGRGLPDEVSNGQQMGNGLTMVETLAMQVSGTVHFSNDKGAKVRISFPEISP